MRTGAKYIVLALLSLLTLTSNALAQGNTQLRVDGERIKSYIAYLSTDEFMGRQSMTPQYQEAAEWVAAQYEAWGLEPAGDNGTYFQRVPISRGLTWYTGIPGVSINGTPQFLDEGEFSINPASTVATTVDAEVVFVGYGISAPTKGLDEYAGLNVRGKVALVLTGSPKDAPAIGGGGFGPAPRTEPEPQEEWTAEAMTMAKIRTAHEKGAAAILLYNPDAAAQSASGFRAPRSQEEPYSPTGDFLAFTITDRTFRSIMKPDFQETVRGFTIRLNGIRDEIKYGTPQSMATGATAQLKGYDTKDVYSEELGNNYCNNVVAKLPGTDRGLRDEFVTMGGHLDHVGVRDGQIRNGADDNASGTAVAMEVARVLKEGNHSPRRTIIFAAWCGEEMGLIGSNYFVSNPPEGVDIDKVVTYFNMDMVGLGDAIGAPGALNFPTIWEVIKRDQDPDVIAAVQPRTGGPGGSDHSAFITRGIESMALMTSGGVGHPNYHWPEDDTEAIQPEILRKTGQFVLQGAINLAEEREVELLIEDRLNLYNAVMLNINSFNPGQGAYEKVRINARNKDGLTALVMDSARAVTDRLRAGEGPQVNPQLLAMMRAQGISMPSEKKTFNRGTSDLALFEGDASLLLAAAEFIGFGRLDIEGDDGHWFSGGEITAEGRRAILELEANDVWIHLASPSESLFSEMLTLASKPFIVSGEFSVNSAVAGQINEKGVILAVTFDPSEVETCLSELEDLKFQLGDTNNLALSGTSGRGLDEAKKALYMGLIEAGWEHLEIVGDRRAGGGVAGGNLRVFSRAPAGMRRR